MSTSAGSTYEIFPVRRRREGQSGEGFTMADDQRRRFRPVETKVPVWVMLVFPALVLVLIVFLFVHHRPVQATMATMAGPVLSHEPIDDRFDRVFVPGCVEPDVDGERAKATVVMLTRNDDIEGVIKSVRSFERHFNRWFHYPYVFLNDKPFNSSFTAEVAKHVSGDVHFGVVGPDLWDFPEWANIRSVKEAIALQGDAGMMYGGLESYHHMCRFYSGKFYHHPLLRPFDWYWRLEPDVSFFCDITYDPFVHMIRNKKVYGWTIAIKELAETVPNLFRHVSAFKRERNIQPGGMWDMFVTRDQQPTGLFGSSGDRDRDGKNRPGKAKSGDDVDGDDTGGRTDDAMEGERYNMCHFWSNFEIASLDWFRSKEYNDFFDHLDRTGGFWTERWGDAPVHSLAVATFLSRSQVHYFRDIGYRHTTIQHCPANAVGLQLPHQPYAEPGLFLDPNLTSQAERALKAEEKYWQKPDVSRANGVGCRCRCDTDVIEIEGNEGTCFPQWAELMGGRRRPG